MVAAALEFVFQLVLQLIFESAIYFRIVRWVIVGAVLLGLWAFGGLTTGAGMVVAAFCLLFLFVTEAAARTSKAR
ncbi:MAG TPA: hypothetical protein PKY73_07720 [Hyphomonas sp.]|nr:hypothetical protein [Hyphomonas sp.]